MISSLTKAFSIFRNSTSIASENGPPFDSKQLADFEQNPLDIGTRIINYLTYDKDENATENAMITTSATRQVLQATLKEQAKDYLLKSSSPSAKIQQADTIL